MCSCKAEKCLKWSALLLVAGALFVSGVQLWLREKSYVFTAEEIAAITNSALKATEGRTVRFSVCMSIACITTIFVPLSWLFHQKQSCG